MKALDVGSINTITEQSKKRFLDRVKGYFDSAVE